MFTHFTFGCYQERDEAHFGVAVSTE